MNNALSLVLDAASRMGLAYDTIATSAEGGSVVAFFDDPKYAYIECLDTGEICAVMSDRRNDPQIWNVDEGSVSSSLCRIRDFIGRTRNVEG